jgi:Tol biopolymer transport system component
MRIRFFNWLTRPFLFPLAFVLMVAIAACGAPSPTPAPALLPATSQPTSPPQAQATFPRPQNPAIEPTPSGSLNLKGRFIFATGDGSLALEDAGSNNPRPVFKATADLYGDSPVFSPDGKQIAFSASSFTKDGAVVQDVRVMNADGTNARVVAAPTDPKVTYGFPAWTPDGKDLYITQSYSVPPSSQHDEIDAVSVNGGALRKVMDNAREATVSPDGKKIVFSILDYQTYSAGLWIANIDGSSRKQLLPSGVFPALYGPRFSPDMQSIVFAESGPASKKLPGAYAFDPPAEDSSCAVAFGFFCFAENAEAHGLPWDLWLVNLDGTKFERLTNLGADSPVPAWSADGKQIAFYDATGIYILDVATKKIYQVSDSRGYGGFDWR